MDNQKRMRLVVENLSILRGYLLDNVRLQKEEGYERLANMTEAEARGVQIAMDNVKQTFEEDIK